MNGHKIVSNTPPPASSHASASLQAPAFQTSGNPDSGVRQAHRADMHALENPGGSEYPGDVIMTLKGFFLIRKR